MTTTRRANTTKTVRTVTNFDSKDAKGRVIGCRADAYEVDFVEVAPGETGGRMPVGHYFVADVAATRDGVRYGACQPDRYFATAEERDAFIAKRVADSRKAAAKKAA